MKVLRLLKTPNWEFPDDQVIRTLFSRLRAQVQFLVRKLNILQGSCHSPPTLKKTKQSLKKNTEQSRQISMFYYLIEMFKTGDHMVIVSLLEVLNFFCGSFVRRFLHNHCTSAYIIYPHL